MPTVGDRALRALVSALALWAGFGAALAQGRARSAPSAECGTAPEPDAVAGLERDGDIRLASGRLIKLLDIRLPAAAAARRRPLDWMASLGGAAVTVRAAGEADRWGRVPSALVLRDGSIDMAELLVAEGFALVSAEERDALCRPDLLALEARARAGRLGLWADAAAAPSAATDLARLTEQVGQFALVEGQVRSVGERAARSYLNFGSFGQPGFTVTIPKRIWSRLQRDGAVGSGLRGRRVRVRGYLEAWRGVTMEITVPSMLEILDDPRP